ncbi:MAG: hypothetical protein M1119_04035 [Firmicutes bacterium]|nr:hypothetical protein [Bacillota bacterium]
MQFKNAFRRTGLCLRYNTPEHAERLQDLITKASCNVAGQEQKGSLAVS